MLSLLIVNIDLFVNNNAVLAGLVHLGDHNGTLAVVGLVKIYHLLEWEITDDVTVEHKEGLVVLRNEIQIRKISLFTGRYKTKNCVI